MRVVLKWNVGLVSWQYRLYKTEQPCVHAKASYVYASVDELGYIDKLYAVEEGDARRMHSRTDHHTQAMCKLWNYVHFTASSFFFLFLDQAQAREWVMYRWERGKRNYTSTTVMLYAHAQNYMLIYAYVERHTYVREWVTRTRPL